ncbi:hypothetical protein NL676_000357 [Syzygium grande]|nr:hypothetical protein NL676_000357 [Syzygium grande]
MGCVISKKSGHTPGYEEPNVLAAATPFTASEVEALYVLFKKLSSSIIADGLIHKEEFQLALFRNRNQRNLFADRIFNLFDMKGNGVIEFGEFVRSLGIFHPNAPIEDKIAFAFRLYDLRHTGYIEPEELKEMVLALLHESDLVLAEDVLETIVDKTFKEVDTKDDGRIDQEEWKDFVLKNPSLMRNMTLPYLKDITLAFPSFIVSSEYEDSEISLPPRARDEERRTAGALRISIGPSPIPIRGGRAFSIGKRAPSRSPPGRCFLMADRIRSLYRKI